MLGNKGIPADAEVQLEARRQFPVVLGVDGGNVGAVAANLAVALEEGADVAGHEIGQGVAGAGGAVKGHARVLLEGAVGIHLDVNPVGADGELMAADVHAEVVGESVVVVEDVAGNCAGTEVAGDRDLPGVIGDGRIDLRAELGHVGDAICADALNGRAGEAGAEGVHHVGADKVGVAQGDGGNAVLESGGGGGEEVGFVVEGGQVVIGKEEACEEGVARGALVIDAAHVLVFAIDRGNTVANDAAGIGGDRKQGRVFECNQVEEAGGDDVADRAGSGGEGNRCALAGGGEDGTEIAQQYGGGGNERLGGGGGGVFLCALEAGELVALQRIAGGGEEVAGVKGIVAEEFEGIAVEGVGATFGQTLTAPPG